MEPTIPHRRRRLHRARPGRVTWRCGDIVMYQRPDQPDHQIVHRIVELKPSRTTPTAAQGDANATDGPVAGTDGRATPPGSRADPCPTSATVALATRSAVGRHTLARGRRTASSTRRSTSLMLADPSRPGNGLVNARHPRRDRVVNPRGSTASSDPADDRRPADAPPKHASGEEHHAVLNKKKAVAGAMIAVGGLALVGVGTGAASPTRVTANSTFKAGTRRPRRSPTAPNFDRSATTATAATLTGPTPDHDHAVHGRSTPSR